jgi:hypothetical protein
MAKSSIVASTIPKSPLYHGNKDAYRKLRSACFFTLVMLNFCLDLSAIINGSLLYPYIKVVAGK